jgi:hypothetical protein
MKIGIDIAEVSLDFAEVSLTTIRIASVLGALKQGSQIRAVRLTSGK